MKKLWKEMKQSLTPGELEKWIPEQQRRKYLVSFLRRLHKYVKTPLEKNGRPVLNQYSLPYEGIPLHDVVMEAAAEVLGLESVDEFETFETDVADISSANGGSDPNGMITEEWILDTTYQYVTKHRKTWIRRGYIEESSGVILHQAMLSKLQQQTPDSSEASKKPKKKKKPQQSRRSEETDNDEPTRPISAVSRRVRLEENDKKSGKSRSV